AANQFLEGGVPSDLVEKASAGSRSVLTDPQGHRVDLTRVVGGVAAGHSVSSPCGLGRGFVLVGTSVDLTCVVALLSITTRLSAGRFTSISSSASLRRSRNSRATAHCSAGRAFITRRMTMASADTDSMPQISGFSMIFDFQAALLAMVFAVCSSLFWM